MTFICKKYKNTVNLEKFFLIYLNNIKMKIESPCRNKCQLNKDRTYCVSCLRLLSEISGWKSFFFIIKKKIINSLELRKS